MLARVFSGALHGVDAFRVDVDLLARGLHAADSRSHLLQLGKPEVHRVEGQNDRFDLIVIARLIETTDQVSERRHLSSHEAERIDHR